MVVENGISGSIKSWADEVANYGNTNKYFKIINGGDCRFQTSDKVWWDITDIEHPIISLNGEIDDDTEVDGKDVFQMVGEFDGNVLRVNDLADSQLSVDEKANLEKLDAFVNGNKDTLTVVFDINEYGQDYSGECAANLDCAAGECKDCTKIIIDSSICILIKGG